MKVVPRWLAVLAVLGGAFGAALGVTPVDAAAPTPEERRRNIAAEVERLRDEIGEVADQEAEVLAELEISRRLRRDLDAKVAGLDAAITVAETELAALGNEVNNAIVAARAATAAVEAAKAQLTEARAVLSEQAVQAYIRLGSAPSLEEMVLNADDVNDSTRMAAYVQAVAERQADVVEHHQALRRETAALEIVATRAKQEVAARRDAVDARKGVLEATRAEQAAARAEIQQEMATEQAALAELRSQRGEYERRLRDLERESNGIAAELRRRQAGQAVTPSGRGVLGVPLSASSVSSRYGYRTHPIYGDRRLHAGIDMRGAVGTPILAAGNGVVAFAGPRGGYGNTVVIDHGGALATLYAHQSVLAVRDGQTVRRGQVIGRVGSSGNSTGPHLHFEVRVSGAPVDPLQYL